MDIEKEAQDLIGEMKGLLPSGIEPDLFKALSREFAMRSQFRVVATIIRAGDTFSGGSELWSKQLMDARAVLKEIEKT